MANKANKTFEFTTTILFKLSRFTVEELVCQVVDNMKITQPALRSRLAKLASQGYSKRDLIEEWVQVWHDDELADLMDSTLTNNSTTNEYIISDLQSGDANGTKKQIEMWRETMAGLGLESRFAEHIESLTVHHSKNAAIREKRDLEEALRLVKSAGYTVAQKKASK